MRGSLINLMKNEAKRRKLPELFLSKKLNLLQVSLLIGVIIAISILVYSPHFYTPFPTSMDEWHAIQQAISISNKAYPLGNFELGFDFFLYLLGRFVNLIFAYQFFPAIWAVISALVLFVTVYNFTDRNFPVSLLSAVFFGAIRSDQNLTGLWFFTALSFSIPFIFLYMFFFAKGLKEQKSKYILISLGIMIFLVFVHAISVLFAVPILVISCLFNIKFVKKKYQAFLLFLLIPLLGLVFYSIVLKTSLAESFLGAIKLVQFGSNWAGELVPTINNSFTEIYPIIGYVLAAIGILSIVLKKRKDLALYAVWPIYLFASIIFYKITGVSYLAPVQRNFYYLAIGLPFVSATGAIYIFESLFKLANKIRHSGRFNQKSVKKILGVILSVSLAATILVPYSHYFPLNPTVMIKYPNYLDLKFLSNFPYGRIIVPPVIVPVTQVISGKVPLGDYFSGANAAEVNAVDSFYNGNNCTLQESIIKEYNISYVLSGTPINCNYTAILSNPYDTIYYFKQK